MQHIPILQTQHLHSTHRSFSKLIHKNISPPPTETFTKPSKLDLIHVWFSSFHHQHSSFALILLFDSCPSKVYIHSTHHSRIWFNKVQSVSEIYQTAVPSFFSILCSSGLWNIVDILRTFLLYLTFTFSYMFRYFFTSWSHCLTCWSYGLSILCNQSRLRSLYLIGVSQSFSVQDYHLLSPEPRTIRTPIWQPRTTHGLVVRAIPVSQYSHLIAQCQDLEAYPSRV